jgi:hypothetical protein
MPPAHRHLDNATAAPSSTHVVRSATSARSRVFQQNPPVPSRSAKRGGFSEADSAVARPVGRSCARIATARKLIAILRHPDGRNTMAGRLAGKTVAQLVRSKLSVRSPRRGASVTHVKAGFSCWPGEPPGSLLPPLCVREWRREPSTSELPPTTRPEQQSQQRKRHPAPPARSW